MAKLFTPQDFRPSVPPLQGTPKKALHDGVKPVTHISVLAMFRNNAPYLDYMFGQLDNWEATYDVQFSYYFLENDSTDDTRSKLKHFFKTHKGKLLLGKLNKDYVNKGENYDRTMTLARLRNSIIDSVAPLPSQWTVFLDSHIYFPVNVLERMLAVEPAKHDMGMLVGYTKQVHLNRILKKMGMDISFNSQPLQDEATIDLNHYYDTYTYIDEEGYSHFPVCAFEKCNMCSRIRTASYSNPLVKASQSMVDVRSAFGGFALIDTEAMNHPRVRWSTLPFDHSGDKSLCDHVLFCDRLKTVTGKRIVLMQDVDDILRTY